jgi:hypothetical protein
MIVRELVRRPCAQRHIAEWVVHHQIQAVVLEQPTRSLRDAGKDIANIERL